MNRLLLVAALLVALPLAAAPKVVVIPFTGKKATAGSSQLSKEICKSLKCVPPNKVAKKDKVDWAKVKKEKVTHVITGKLSGKKTEVIVQNSAKKTVMKKSYAVGANGRFFGIKDLVSDVEEAVGGGGGEEEEAPPPKEEKKEVVEETPPPKEEKVEEKKEEETREERVEKKEEKREEEAREETREDKREEEAREEKREEEETPEPTRRVKPPLAIAQVGVDIGPRLFTYAGVGTRNLRSYRAYFIFQPRLRAEIYPLARILKGIPAGIGFDADYSFAVGLQSSPTGGPSYATRMSKLDFGLRLRMTPIEDSQLVINPVVGYRMQSFSTQPTEDGSRLEGLTDIGYTAIRAGASIEQPILDGDGLIMADLVALPLLGTGALSDFFPQNSGFGFEVGGGFAYRIAQNLQAKIGVTLTRYGLTFTTSPTDTYVAESATDLYINGTLAVRYVF